MEQRTKLYADGIHDDTAAIQEMLDRRGLVTLPSGSYLIKRPLIIHSDTHFKLAPTATLRLADGANCSLLDNDGLYTQIYNRNITVEGGIWDGNHLSQKREYVADENQPFDRDKYIANTLLVLMIRFVYTEHLTVKNVTFKNPTSFAIHIAGARYFTVENVHLDYELSNLNMDGVHIQGPARFGRICNIRGNANDDHVALCANGTTRSEITHGDIEDVDIDGVYCDNGYTGVRLLSCGDAIRNVHVSNIHGEFRVYAVSLTHHYPIRQDKPILLENIHISDVYASKSQGFCHDCYKKEVEIGALIWLEHGITCRNVTVENVYRNEKNPETKAPTIRISEKVSAENLRIRNINESFVGERLPTLDDRSGVGCKIE